MKKDKKLINDCKRSVKMNLTLISIPSVNTRPIAEPINVNNVVNNPQLITNKPPQHWYNLFKNKGFNPQPLSRGSLQGIPFENGGGFKITWGGDKILQFHPTGAHHGGIGYWKISSGSTGTIRFDLNGNVISN